MCYSDSGIDKLYDSEMRFIDFSKQYKSIQEEVEERVLKVMRSTRYIMGEEVDLLERDFASYIGSRYAISVASGTDALILALLSCGIGEGDEVITSPFTFFATAESISRVGAKPVFVDIKEDTFNIDPSQIESRITNKTKAILPVHIFGNPCCMNDIIEIAQKNNLKVIEDACQAIGATYNGVKTGNLGDVGCFSFFPTKNLGGMGDGGMITTNNEHIATIIKSLKNHGSGEEGRRAAKLLGGKIIEPHNYSNDYGKYCNYLVGYNSRLDEMQAAVLNVKLKYIDNWNALRRNIAESYKNKISYNCQCEELGGESVYHQVAFCNNDRDSVIKNLKDNGIPFGTYYLIPLHKQSVYAHDEYYEEYLPVVEGICSEVFSLPIYPEITQTEQQKVIDVIRSKMK